ncbi:FadR/GntR family transcriptional regulator [Labrys okinawensis]|uniref:FadR/GntR family transcriptional regulator n=1 Tax=Labrys okinawensis TaxID=346911 RepID=UPI0039BC4218
MSVQTALSVLEHVPELRHGVVRRQVRELVADKIASLIAAGILQVADTLPSERHLAVALQVSRETVRGAMQILAGRGIIGISHGARTRVLSADVGPVTSGLHEPRIINRYDIEAIHAARLLVERPVVADAARRVDAATLAMLESSLEAQREAIGDPVRFLICDREFHVAIYRACGNDLLADFVIDLYLYAMPHRRKAVSQPGAIALSCQDHAAILAGLRARDPKAVVAAFGIHLDRIYTTTRSILEEEKAGADT